jgi:FMN phosphatase YigB (HAD superfamily)
MAERKKRPEKDKHQAEPASNSSTDSSTNSSTNSATDSSPDDLADKLADRLDDLAIGPNMEALTLEEKEAFLARVRTQGRSLTSEEQYAIFGPPQEQETSQPAPQPIAVEEMEAAPLDAGKLQQLQSNFFPELGTNDLVAPPPLVRGIIFDFDYTLAVPFRSLDELMEEGAKAAEQYMRGTGMDFPEDFWHNIVEARRFAQEKSVEEAEEHIADDAMSFLLQFFGYPASKMDPNVLRQAVDIFYAPEMTGWQLAPGAEEMLEALVQADYKLALIANYNCDRAFQRTIDYLGLRRYFDLIITSAAVEYRKPDAKIFEPVLERWDALPYEVVIVGDSLVDDIGGGLELGTLTVQTTFAQAPQVAFDNEQAAENLAADAQIQRLDELLHYVAEWAQA